MCAAARGGAPPPQHAPTPLALARACPRQHEEFNRDHAFQRFCQHVAKLFRKRPLWLPDGRRNMIKLKGGGHVEHHAETYDDMSLKKDPRWRRTPAAASLDSDAFRGTAFTWEVRRADGIWGQRGVRAGVTLGSSARPSEPLPSLQQRGRC